MSMRSLRLAAVNPVLLALGTSTYTVAIAAASSVARTL